MQKIDLHTACTHRKQTIAAKDLPLSCPRDGQDLAHPKVYLPIEKTGEVICPYCSTHYFLK